ncbi:MAG: hypothetical protein WCW84_10335 [Sulfurimonas sp.]|jgi:hypothetical protein
MNNDIDDYKNTMDHLTQMSLENRQAYLRWLSKQNDLIVQDVFKLQKTYFHRLKNSNLNAHPILMAQVSFFEALEDCINTLKMPNQKNRFYDFKEMKKVSAARAKQFRKARLNSKHEKLLNLQSVIMNLRESAGYSSRQVSAYLLKNHKFKISHTAILKFEKTIKKGKNDAQTNNDN